ncbi:MAG: hypothetical protein WCK35_29760 [Chloroflexota bacterium]
MPTSAFPVGSTGSALETRTATENIHQQIGNVQRSVDQAISGIELIASIAAMIAEQSVVTRDVAESLTKANTRGF